MAKWSRRKALSGGAGIAVNAVANLPVLSREGNLGLYAAKKGLLFGAAMSIDELSPESQRIFAEEVRFITPSNELKMTGVQPDKGTISFTRADALTAFADKHAMRIRGHTLVWNEYQPKWVYTLSGREIESLIDSHIDLVCGRYRGRIHSWDVVNEPLRTDESASDWLAPGPYFNALGPAYIARSLRRARAADPAAKLLINETHTEREDDFGIRQRQRLLRLIDELQHAGVPLDAIGLQGHLEPPARFESEGFIAFCHEISNRKLDIQITELDVTDVNFPDDLVVRDALVAETIYKFLSAALRCDAVKLVATWHLADNYSFYYREAIAKGPPTNRRRPRPLLLDEKQRRKPAWHAVARSFVEMAPRQ